MQAQCLPHTIHNAKRFAINNTSDGFTYETT